MGCQCFRPPKSHRQVYTKIIQQIYDTACSANLTQQTQLQKQQNQIYQLILEKLTKKGDIRKLVDNLSSRKQKIIDCAILNYKYLIQSKILQEYCAGLIILDSIVEIIYHKKQQTLSESEGQTSEQSVSSMKESFSKFTDSTYKKFSKMKEANQQMNYNGLDLHYFKTIQLIFQKQQLKQNILKSIIKFSSNHPSPIRSEAQVWKFINKIYFNVSSNVQKNLGCEAMKNLLFKTKDQICQEMKTRDIILFLIFAWIEQQSKNQKTSFKENCQQILKIYFHRFASSWDSEYIYQTILCAFDKIQCDSESQTLLLKLCYIFMKGTEICNTFQRCLFNYTLGYLSKIQEKNESKAWLISLGVKLDTMNALLKNATKSNVKLFTFKRINNWIQKEYVDINEFCLYNSKGLIEVFTINLIFFIEDKIIFDSILKQFSQLFSKTHNETKIRLIENAIQEFRGESQLQKNNVLFTLIKQMTNNIKKQQITFNGSILCMPIESQMEQQNKKLVIKLNTMLIPFLNFSNFDELQKRDFANFLYSHYFNIAYSICLFSDRYRITKQSLTYLYTLYPNINRNIYLAYVRNLNQSIRQNKFNLMSIQIQFCILYLNFSLRKMTLNKQIPVKLFAIKQNLQKQQDSINNCLPKLVVDFDIKYYLQNYFQQNENQAANQKVDTIYLEYYSIFSRLFNSQECEKTQITEQKTMGYQRRNSNTIYQSQNMKSLDRSFEDALDALAEK